MKKIRLFLTALFLVVSVAGVLAQNITVTGTVTDSQEGYPLAGAGVQVKGQSGGVATDLDGQYSIKANANDVLVFTYINYVAEEVAVNGKAVVNVSMNEDAVMLEETIVVAYGTANKKSFTGSASVISGDKISKRPVSNISKALAGSTAGVQVVSASGQPGSSASIKIRGVGSINASSSPLIVLDGVPYDGSLSSISANDIESFTVLKDAAANSMFGSRGANGVVMITTKKGQNGKTKVNFEIREGLNTRGVPAYDVMRDPGEYLELQWASINNYAQYDKTADLGGLTPAQFATNNLLSSTYGTGGYNPYNVADIIGADGKLNPNAQLMYWDDWMEIPFRTGLRQEYIADISGGNDKTSFFMSLSYLDEEGYTQSSDFNRFAARAKVDHQATSWFKMGMNMSYSRTMQNSLQADSNDAAYSNLFMFAQNIAPYYPVYTYDNKGGLVLDSFGNPIYDFGDNKYGMGTRLYGANTNPYATQIHDNRGLSKDQITATGYVDVTFLKDFKFTANVSANSSSYDQNSYQTPIGGDAQNVGGRNQRTYGRDFSLNAQQLLTYNKSLGYHSFDFLLGHETNTQQGGYLYGYKENFLIPDNPELDNAARLLSAGSSQSKQTLQSVFVRGQYNYDNKYFATASYRRDASSVFHPDVRWGGFWSAGASWRIDQEDFMESSRSWLTNLKLKASYGTQGNDNIGLSNAYEDMYDVISLDGEIGISYVYRGVPDLSWEKSNNFNIGAEFEFFGSLRGSFEYYNKTTKDLLYKKPLPGSMGSPSWIFTNAIDMRNSGVELELAYDVVKNENVFWNVAANITYQKNQILKLPEDRDVDGNGYRNGSYFYKVGGGLYDYYLFESAGVDPETGHALWYKDVEDENGNVTKETTSNYGEATYYQTGKSGMPNFYGGLSTTVEAYGFDLSIYTSYQIGGWGYDSVYSGLMANMDSPGNNVHVDALKAWNKQGQVTDVPVLQFGLQNQNAQSTRFLTSKTMFSLDNITLGYSLPERVNDILNINKLRVYMSANNVALSSARKGFDPRVSYGGGNRFNYSATRTVSFGVNLSF